MFTRRLLNSPKAWYSLIAYMLLKTKLAFEIWAGIVLLIVVIGGAAGFTLMGNDITPLLTKTQVNIPEPSAQPLLSESEILHVSDDISNVLSGGTP